MPDVAANSQELLAGDNLSQSWPQNQQAREVRSSRASVARASRRTFAQNIAAGEDSGPPDDDDGTTGAILRHSFGSEDQPRTFRETIREMQKKTLLDEDRLHDMEETQPGMAAWLMTLRGLVAQMGLFVIFIGMDAGKSLFASKALKSSAAISTTVVIISSLCSIIVGIGISAYCDGPEGVKMATNPKAVIKFSLIAAMFAVAQCFNTLSYTVLTAGTIKIFGQLRLLNTAVLSHVFLKRRYLGTQWATLFIVCLGALCFMQGKTLNGEVFYRDKKIKQLSGSITTCDTELRGFEASIAKCKTDASDANGQFTCIDKFISPFNKTTPKCAFDLKALKDKKDQESNMLLGLMYVGIYLFVSDVGSIISEKWLKEESDTPFYVQKVAIELSGFPVSIAMSFIIPYFQQAVGVEAKRYQKNMWWNGDLKHLDPPGCKLGIDPGCEDVANSFFQGWGGAVFGSLFFSCVGSWLSGMVVKKMSSVMKLLGKVISLAVVYFLGDMWLLQEAGKPPPHLAQTIAQFIVMLGTYTFLNIKAPKPPPKKEEKSGERPSGETEMSGRAQA